MNNKKPSKLDEMNQFNELSYKEQLQFLVSNEVEVVVIGESSYIGVIGEICVTGGRPYLDRDYALQHAKDFQESCKDRLREAEEENAE